MAKYSEVGEFNVNIFADQVAEADLERVLNVKVLADDRQKKIFKVIKANPLVKHMTGEDVIVVINEKIFNGLEDNQKRLVADEAITYIGFDFEKDKIHISNPDINVHTGILRKYGNDIYIGLQEQIKLIYDQKKEVDKELGVD